MEIFLSIQLVTAFWPGGLAGSGLDEADVHEFTGLSTLAQHQSVALDVGRI